MHLFILQSIDSLNSIRPLATLRHCAKHIHNHESDVDDNDNNNDDSDANETRTAANRANNETTTK